MKKSLLKIVILSSVFVIGTSLSLNNTSPIALYATQHIDNYAEYHYSGHYYDSLDGTFSEGLQGTLRQTLTNLIFPEDWYTYSGSSAGQLGKVLQDADEDPTNGNNMVLFYSRDSITKRGSGGNTTDWNREHVWPQSLSNDHWGKTEAGTDILHIRPTWYTTNNTRGNIVYGDAGKRSAQKYEGMTYAYIYGNRFEPIDSVKGDVARILMYVWTAYNDYYHDTGLVVTKAIESYDTLLKWHTMDAPDALEASRNNFSENSIQRNRNPFVDHPEYAWQIFGDSASAAVKQECKNAYPLDGQHSSSSSSSAPISSESSQAITSSEPSSSIEPSENSSEVISSSSETSEAYSISESSIISSETSTSSIEATASLESSQQDELTSSSKSTETSNNNASDTNKKSRGCNGSVLMTASLTSLTALAGLAFVLFKKKQ